MTSLLEASSIPWGPASSACSPTSEPFELELWEVLQAALGAATTAVTSTVFSGRKRARPTVEPAAAPEKVQQQQQEAPSPLDDAAGVEQLLGAGFEQVFGKHALSAPGSLFPRDHLFRALVSAGLIKDERVFFKSSSGSTASSSTSLSSLTSDSSSTATTTTAPVPLAVLVGAYALGDNGCGHAGITHGGLTAALFDESVGELLYIAKMKGLMKFKFVVTASLEVSYKKPWSPSTQPAYVTAYISEVQGRKIWVEAVIADAPLTGGPGAPLPMGCSVYATAKALFLEPRPEGSSSAALQRAAEGRPDQLGAGGAGKA